MSFKQYIVSAALAIATGGVTAQTNFNVGSFTKDGCYAIANQLGLFSALNIVPNYLTVPNSNAAYNNLNAGVYDILLGTFDNTLNRDVNGEPTYPLNYTVLGGGDNAPGLALWSTAAFTTPQSLKGAVIGVDAVNSGYVYALQKLLSLYGLQYPRDYSYSALGATPTRVAALNAGTINATIFTYPYTEQQQVDNAAGLNELLVVNDHIPLYQSTAFHVLTSSLADNTTTQYQQFINFTVAQLQARQILTDSLTDNNTKQQVITALATEFNVTSAVAQLLYADAIAPNGYLANPNLTISSTQIAQVAYIRQQAGGFTSFGGSASSATDVSNIFQTGPGHIVNYVVRDAALTLLQQITAAQTTTLKTAAASSTVVSKQMLIPLPMTMMYLLN